MRRTSIATSTSTSGSPPVVITDDLAGAEPVICELRSRGIEPFVLGSGELADARHSAAVYSDPQGQIAELQTGDSWVRIDPDTRIWRWKAGFPGLGQPIDSDSAVNAMKVDQYRSFVRSLWETPARWMNRYADERRLDQNKTLGAEIARAEGLLVPPTIVTDSPDLFRRFVSKSSSDTFAIKAPATWAAITDEQKAIATYTSKLNKEQALAVADRVQYAPVIVQPYIEKEYELRVTIVDNRAFSCRIDSQSADESGVDWRLYPTRPVDHEESRLPEVVEQALLRYVRRCGLVYAAIDMIATPQGDHVFLEVNPGGQYLWIEALTGMPITAAIADWLTGVARDR